MRTFIIADMHFDDVDIMRYEDRPFDTVEAMNKAIIDNWNSVVTEHDSIYILGDIGNCEYINKLKGKKYLVKGNHDTLKNEAYRDLGFEEVYDLPVIYDGFFMMSHEPLYVNANMPYANIFGHVHNNPNYKSASEHGFCVSVERIDYTPIDLEEIRRIIKNA